MFFLERTCQLQGSEKNQAHVTQAEFPSPTQYTSIANSLPLLWKDVHDSIAATGKLLAKAKDTYSS